MEWWVRMPLGIQRFRVERGCPGRFAVQVVDPVGRPHPELTLYANKAGESLSRRSVPVYLGEIVRAFGWAHRDPILSDAGVTLLGSPSDVRRILWDYLTADCRCLLRERRDRNTVHSITVRSTDETRVSVKVTLSALKHFYHVLNSAGVYGEPNPLVSAELERDLEHRIEVMQRDFESAHGRHSPRNSGGVDDNWAHRLRYSTNYFQLIDGDWKPKIIADPKLHILIYRAGHRFGWGLREQVIARILLEAGPRGFEVAGRTLSDWLPHDCLQKLESASKGSNDKRVKTLAFSTATANLLRRYWDTERASHERGPYKTLAQFRRAVDRKELKPESVPIFLSHSGRPYSIATFRDYYWRPALEAAGLRCQIQQTRHWFVTRALTLIDETSKSEVERRRRRDNLIKYMKWR
ncbi:MAG: hypothetical protein ACLGI7_01545, partial [Gammaproteobacteria bacterium]